MNTLWTESGCADAAADVGEVQGRIFMGFPEFGSGSPLPTVNANEHLIQYLPISTSLKVTDFESY